MSEKELIERIALGDEGALKILHEQYYERLVRFLYRITLDKEHIVEIVNDIFFIIWNGAKNFRSESTVSTWIFGIAYKKGLQSTSRWKSLESLTEQNANIEDDQEGKMINERSATQLLRQLPAQQRAVMELTYYFGYSYREISEIVNCPENTVKTRMFHGRQKLKSLMQEKQYA